MYLKFCVYLKTSKLDCHFVSKMHTVCERPVCVSA